MKKKTYTDGVLYNGDCLELMKSMKTSSVDLVFGSGPYTDARTYHDAEKLSISRRTDKWVWWMMEIYKESLRICKGLVAYVVDDRTQGFRYNAGPLLLAAELHRAGVHLRKPPIYHRHGIFGGGGPDWLNNTYEFIICATNGGRLPWSNPTACGHPPKFPPGGNPSHRKKDGTRVSGKKYTPPDRANPGNLISCSVGGGHLGSKLASSNEAPFPESLAAFFVRSFCPRHGVVMDPFCGSGTTLAVAIKTGRYFIGCDLRKSQYKLSKQRIREARRQLPIGL